MSITAITAIAGAAVDLITKFVPDPNKKAEMLARVQELEHTENLAELQAYVRLVTAQIEVNKAEASHKSIFVAGWRPFIGWIGGIAMLYQFVAYPILTWFISTPPPVIATDQLWVLLSGMLGISGMRSFDKMKGTDTHFIGR